MDAYEKLAMLECLSSDSDGADIEELLLYSLLDEKTVTKKAADKKPTIQHTKMADFPDEVYPDQFGMTKEQFTDLHEIIKKSIKSPGCNLKQPIGSKEKLGVFLRYLVSGDSFRSIAKKFRLGDRSVSKIVRIVSAAIWDKLQPIYLKEPTTEAWDSISTRFEEVWNFPHCVGALGAKHVVIGKPGRSGTFYSNYKHTFAFLLLVAVDADFKFINVDIGEIERFGQWGNSFYTTEFGKRLLAKNELLLPMRRAIPPFRERIPFVFLGDDTFPLAENLMKPYTEKMVNGNKDYEVFNSRLLRALQTVECTLAMTASKFRVLRKAFECKDERVKDIVKAACVLHNYLMCTADEKTVDMDRVKPLARNQLFPMRGAHASRYTDKSRGVRELFSEYFSLTSEGSNDLETVKLESC